MLAAIGMLICVAVTAAPCIVGPRVSTDKTLHLVGNAAIVFGSDAALKAFAPAAFEAAPYLGIVPALAMSAMREFDKSRMGGRCEYSSMVYDATGIAFGAASTRWLLLPEPRGVQFAYTQSF
ncbi:MAG TPA: hypothetical protein VES00_03475 [Burkholderiaceae bacterium]|nr:hypothetical protein [Burkholderiaceae bacterium]